jgi:hypothetical protein
MLAKLLSLLSGDLCLRQFVYYYWRDFPEICPANPDQAKTGQLSEGHLTGLNAPMGMRETQPPNIHQVKILNVTLTALNKHYFSICLTMYKAL